MCVSRRPPFTCERRVCARGVAAPTVGSSGWPTSRLAEKLWCSPGDPASKRFACSARRITAFCGRRSIQIFCTRHRCSRRAAVHTVDEMIDRRRDSLVVVEILRTFVQTAANGECIGEAV